MNNAYEFDENALKTLYHISRELSSDNDLSEILGSVLGILEENAGMQRGTIAILKPSGDELSIDISRGLSSSEVEKGWYSVGEGILGRVVETGKPVAIPKLSEEPSFLDKTGARKNISKDNLSFLCVPVKSGTSIIGTLSFDRIITGKDHTLEDELRFLEAVADLIARVVLARRKQKEQMEALRRENKELKEHLSELESSGKSNEIIGNSGSMKAMYTQIAQVAPLNTIVLLRGETGTGKELVARSLHRKSRRSDASFIPVNCAAIPDSLLESELFGHTKGSFTGATSDRTGFFEEAEGGTLFLDEIGEMSNNAQSRLLRAIQEKEIYKIGSSKSRKIDVRLICATNKNLEEAVKTGGFREDLYYRINVMSIFIPPLRERGADLLLLADHFTNKYSRMHNKPITRLSTPAIEMLSAYHWPGNVRELENVIERSVILSLTNVIEGHDLPPTLQMKKGDTNKFTERSLTKKVEMYEKELIIEALKDTNGNQTEAASILQTTKRIMQYKISKYGIDFKKFRKGEQ
ncbi:MAG: sigma 54-interacting transcriptional regulator [Chitinivibrionales bacterium]